MLSISVNDSPFPADQPQHLTISRIELFVIPAIAVDAAGYRVCIRLTSEYGYGWSEQFLCETESLDLDDWSHHLRPFIGEFPLSSLTERLTERIAEWHDADSRMTAMFAAALTQLTRQAGQPGSASLHAEESVLQQRAIAYISID
ncbi:hypothetical protein M6D81_16745 [Paenibacillus sp. J5C_2022]|uniref:hypothetical protein n=1 Tax=Paenibacillus sp. J5C2022 TaxID=2977129 RepID=UPI0021D3D3E8|nr:hypothetical protein [Paenibacillus sp. J5C2022]MCU6710350.1 hypothetical protein [Paenibacillus sp. J5C2022]